MLSFLSTARLARASARRPWLVLGAWVVVLGLAMASASSVNDVITGNWRFTSEPESVRAENLLQARMGESRAISETVIVRSESTTVDDAAFQRLVEETTADLLALDGVVALATNYYQAVAAGAPEAEMLVSDDRHATLISVTLTSYDAAIDRADELLHVLDQREAANSGFELLSIGQVSIDETFNSISEQDLRTAEMRGLPVALVILVIVFGALVAAGLPIALALGSITIAVGLATLIGRAMELSFYVVNMITMIGLAVGIDYALFVIERYREERQQGRTKLDAIEVAGGTASKAVLFSGLTVVLGLIGLLMIPTTIFQSLGVGAMLAVIVAVAATQTLIPALLSLLGDRIDWPRRRHQVSTRHAHTRELLQTGFWASITRVVMARPIASVLIAGGLLVLAAVPLADLQTGRAGVETLPESDVKRALQVLSTDFSAGLMAPVQIVVDGERGNGADAGIDRLATALAGDAAFDHAASPPHVVWSEAGDLALMTALFSVDASSPAADEAIVRLREQHIPAAFAETGVEALVAGEAAMWADFFALADDVTIKIFAFVLGLSFILLTLAFRSIVVPAKAILMNLLSVGATYGLLVLVFQKGVGADLFGFQRTPTIEAWIPIFLFCVLFGLSMDYHVFLLSRIREHYDRTLDNRESVALGLQTTGKIITGAALIMVAVFAGFASGQLVMFQQMGFGLAVAVLLDATIVRTVLVPASMALLGKRNWYLPSWLLWLPDLRVEGAPVPAPATADITAGD